MRIDFHCGRCRLRGSIEASAELDASSIERLNQFVIDSHRELFPNCKAQKSSIQILSIAHREALAS